MKKNILIGFLLLIILILSIKILSPVVITSKKAANIEATSQTSKEVVTETTTENNTIKTEKEEISSTSDYGIHRNESMPSYFEEKEHVPVIDKDLDKKTDKPQENDFYKTTTDFIPAPAPKNNPETKIIPKAQRSEMEENISVCKPYKEKMSAEYLGMLIDYELIIRGWINDKCVIDFVSTVKGTGASFSKTYNIDPNDAEIFKFAPQIKCQFTKQQLLYVGDSILQEKERDNGATNNMLKNPNNIHLPKMQNISGSDARLLEIVIGNSACEMVDNGNFNDMIKDLFN